MLRNGVLLHLLTTTNGEHTRRDTLTSLRDYAERVENSWSIASVESITDSTTC